MMSSWIKKKKMVFDVSVCEYMWVSFIYMYDYILSIEDFYIIFFKFLFYRMVNVLDIYLLSIVYL